MKPSELYALPPLSIEYNVDDIIDALAPNYHENNSYFKLFEQLHNSSSYDIHTLDKTITAEKRVKTHFHMKEYDDENVANLSSVFFDDKPFLIIKKFGYESCNHDVYVTDLEVFKSFEHYIQSHLQHKPMVIHHPDEELDDLINVDGHLLTNYYNYQQQNKYAVNDLVWAYVPVAHEKDEHFISTLVKITKISPFDIYNTYEGEQVHRVWRNGELIYSPTNKKNGYHATLNEALILGKMSEIAIPDNSVENLSDEDGSLNPYYQGPSLQDLYNIYNKKQKLKPKP